MATDVERLIVRLEATQRQFERQLAAANATANRRARQIESRFAQMNRKLGQSFAGLGRSLAAGFAAGFTVRELKQLSDAATQIDNALKVAGLSGAELDRVYGRLRDSAMANAAPLEALVGLYSRAAQAQQTLGVTTEELLGLTNSVAQSLRISGTDAQTASGALLQLGQALASGKVQAEEYNSLLDGLYPLLQAAAAGLREAGGDVAVLTRLVKDGQVSSEAFFRAIEAGAPILEQRLAGAQLTVDQALGNLQTALIDTAREFNRATGASGRFADGINVVAQTINNFDVSGFLDKISDAYDAMVRFLNDAGNAQIFKDLNEALGITEGGEMINLDAEAAKQEAAALEREVELLQQTIEKNTELGFDNAEALARLDEVRGRLAQLRAEIANMPATALDPIAVRNRDAAIMASEKARRTALGAGARPEIKPVSLSDYTILSDNGGSGGGGGRGRGGGSSRPNDYQREIEQLRERIALTQAMTAAQAELNPLINDYGYSLERAATIVELENAAKRAGIQITPQLRVQIEELAGAYATATAEAARLAEEQDRVRQAAEEMRDLGKNVMGGFIQDMMNGVDATEALANALGKVADKLLDMALNSLFSGSGGGGLLGGLIIPGILHSGGVAGKDGYGHGRAVSPSVFTGAKRYHRGGVAGLQPGEVPAILQKGEVVLPRGAKVSSEGRTIYAPQYNIDARGAEAGVETKIRQALQDYDRGSYSRWVSNFQQAKKRNVT